LLLPTLQWEIYASLGGLRRERGKYTLVWHKKTTSEKASTGKQLKSHSAALALFISMHFVA